MSVCERCRRRCRRRRARVVRARIGSRRLASFQLRARVPARPLAGRDGADGSVALRVCRVASGREGGTTGAGQSNRCLSSFLHARGLGRRCLPSLGPARQRPDHQALLIGASAPRARARITLRAGAEAALLPLSACCSSTSRQTQGRESSSLRRRSLSPGASPGPRWGPRPPWWRLGGLVLGPSGVLSERVRAGMKSCGLGFARARAARRVCLCGCVYVQVVGRGRLRWWVASAPRERGEWRFVMGGGGLALRGALLLLLLLSLSRLDINASTPRSPPPAHHHYYHLLLPVIIECLPYSAQLSIDSSGVSKVQT